MSKFNDDVGNYMGYLEDIGNLLKSDGHLDEARTLSTIFGFLAGLNEPQKPEKFDPIEHMQMGGWVSDQKRRLYKIGFEKNILFKSNEDDDTAWFTLNHNMAAFINDLVFTGDLAEYTIPEPTPMELIEKARSCMTETFGVAHGTEIDALNAVIDALEKTIEEK